MSAFLVFSAVQGGFMMVDEFFFHHRRHMPRWERIGHPIDTLSVLCCFAFLLFTEPTPLTRSIYYALVVISCVLVTKDEWVHKKYCQATELWLHAVLFILHPCILISALYVWTESKLQIYAIGGLVLGFLFYQIFYWNFYANRALTKRLEEN